MPSSEIEDFIARWSPSGGGERSNYQLFLTELCELLDVSKPDPAVDDDAENAYVFDRSVRRQEADGSTTTNFIDLYKRGCFICETKQGVEKVGRMEADLRPPSEPSNATPNFRPTKRGHGIRGSGAWDTVMEKARNQAEGYARALPASEGRPPFLLIIDVGYSFELFAEFTCTGGTYVRFPDPRAYRFKLEDLRDEKKRDLLRQIWLDPHSLDPAKRSAKVTREIADQLAKLARSFEKDGHDPQIVAEFIMRCIFTMFAEDVRLLPENAFRDLLESLRKNLGGFPVMIEALWKDMANGSQFSTVIREKVLHFNGGLFESATALRVTENQLELLITAAKADWRDVEPAIFGTLLERALSPRERHKLGAHYTPRAYVERLVFPTVIDPLREEWETVKTAAATLTADAGELEARIEELESGSGEVVKGGDAKAAKSHATEINKLKKSAERTRKEAVEEVRKFHHQLCKTRVLDPACGSGNFLYVTMEHMKRLEGEVLELLTELGDPQLETEMREFKVRPHQFIGLEINPWAVPIAELVLWIGYLQWHFRTSAKAVPDDPVISKEHSIRKQDAVLAYDKKEIITWAMARENPDLPGLPDEVRRQLRRRRGDEAHSNSSEDRPPNSETGQSLLTSSPTKPITVWDGRTMKKHAVTGKDVPDETARVPLWHYVNPRKAEWPEADYIVGNPPFLGASRMREDLGDGYAETLRSTYKELPESCDFVMYWWDKAGHLVREEKLKRFGFITTKAIGQTFNRRVVEPHLAAKKLASIIFAIPNHPWVDSADGADVRIAMTVATSGEHSGELVEVASESAGRSDVASILYRSKPGKILPDLSIGPDLVSIRQLDANRDLSNRGVCLFGAGFIVSETEAVELGLGRIKGIEKHIRHYRNGRDLTSNPRNAMVIDLFGLTVEEVKGRFPEVYQWVLNRVKPERDHNNREARKRNWWLFGETNPKLRKQLLGLSRYIATVETSKHRFFVFLDDAILPDNMLVNIALQDGYGLGVLSSGVHIVWALAAGGRLGIGNDPRYNKTRCFETFPFPDPDEATREWIRELGEKLDAHRKRQQELHPGLTLTGMYNVLEKLRSGEALTAKEKQIHEQGLVSVLQQIHDDLDEAVYAAYGWGDLLVGRRSRGAQTKAPSGRNAGTEVTSLQDSDQGSAGASPYQDRDEILLERLVALNHERAEEEKRGKIRWLRPDFQNPTDKKSAVQDDLDIEDAKSKPAKKKAAKAKKLTWPKNLAEQVSAVHRALEETGTPQTADQIAKQFTRPNKDRITEILETLTALGKARATDDGTYQA